jgi:hypothetical protein
MINLSRYGIKVCLVKTHRSILSGTVHIKSNLTSRNALQLGIDLASDSVSNGNYHDYGGNSDNNAQHGKDGTPFIAPDIHQCNLNVFPNLCHLLPHFSRCL